MLISLAFRFEKFSISSAGVVYQTVHIYNSHGSFELYSLFSILCFVTRLAYFNSKHLTNALLLA